MSKNSAKQNLTQLKSWLESRGIKTTRETKPRGKFSKMNHYKSKR